MTRRGLIRHLGDLNKVLSCQVKDLSYCRRKYTLSVIDRHFNSKLLFNTCIIPSTRHFCDRVGQEHKRSTGSDETNTDGKEKTDEKADEEKAAKAKFWKKLMIGGVVVWISCASSLAVLELGIVIYHEHSTIINMKLGKAYERGSR
jgi:hypothetical protein